ncbi:MAG: pyridoxine 5'-phosphate synthase [Chitinophagales bacterium]|jgi:pyridoxine 5-phosphate synthase|nr:pyridoxine 5'-phosphate synthase [Sphingobacteriales bacterium]
MTKLSVNINKVATIRNARGGDYPNLLEFAKKCMEYGADGITIHPRPDQRHIKFHDVEDLSQFLPTENCEFNIEGYPDAHFIDMGLKHKPTQVTLVPDPPHILTSDSGWDTITQEDFLRPIIEKFKHHGIRVSLFMDTDETLIRKAKELGAERIEFYTGQYFKDYPKDKEKAIEKFVNVYKVSLDCGLVVNAGHDLNRDNLAFFKQNLPELAEVSIGHWLISDCLYYGLQNVIPMYKRLLV